MRTYLTLFLSLVMLALATCISCKQQQHEIIEITEPDSIEQNYEEYLPTVYDVLEEREEMRYMRMIDSVYLTIPEQILTHLLVTKGTTISILEIVEDYIVNKQFYHNTILRAMNIQKQYVPSNMQKQYLPDSIPRKAPIDKPYESLNLTDSTLLN